MSLSGKAALVVGGVGPIGRAITRGLLQAGAKVIVNSRSDTKLSQLYDDLEGPDKLHLVHGSLLPSSVDRTIERILDVATPAHVIAHSAVAWWGELGAEDETRTLNIPRHGQSVLDMERSIFAENAGILTNMHFGVAQQLIPKMRPIEGASYTFVTGTSAVLQRQISSLTRINAHHVSGLAAALRAEAKTRADDLFMSEIRVGHLPLRDLPSVSKDPNAVPLSSELGMLCAGIAQAAERWAGPQAGGDVHSIESVSDLMALRARFPVEELPGAPLKTLWHWQSLSKSGTAAPRLPTGED